MMRYQYYWRGDRMIVYELDGHHLCHVYTARHHPESSTVRIHPVKGGYRDPHYRYDPKWVALSLMERIDPPPAMPKPAEKSKKPTPPSESQHIQIKLI